MITAAEKRWIWIFSGVVVAVTTFPYLLGFANQGEGWRFSGLLIASEDGNSYLAKMLLGANSGWLFRTPYTAAPQRGFLAFLPYILLGKLAGGEGITEQMAALFQLFRAGGVVAVCWATYAFMARFVTPFGLRRLGTALGLFGGGLGFLSILGWDHLWQGVMRMPLEFYSPETFGFLSIFAIPHLAWGRALLLWGLLRHLNGHSRRDGVWVGFYWIGLGLMQPLTVVSAWAVQGSHLAGWALWNWRGNRGWRDWRSALERTIISGLVSSPLVLYNLLSFQFDPFLRKWQSRNLIPSPPPGDYLLAFAIVLPFVIAGLWSWRKAWSVERVLPAAWLVVFPFLAYAPHNLQRRLPEGIWVALCVLAMSGLAVLGGSRARRWGLLLGTAFLSTLLLYSGTLLGVMSPGMPLFRPIGEVMAMDALARQVPNDSVVLAAYDTSNVLPTRARVRVLIGHGPESLDLEEIQPRVEAFFAPETSRDDRFALIDEFGVGYIFYGPQERALGKWEPGQQDGFTEIYNANDYIIYQVKRTGQ